MSTFTFDIESLKSGPLAQQAKSFESGLYANTPDDKLTYSGNDPIVWDRVNNERLRRGLSPLPGSRPVDDGRTYNTGRGSSQSTTPTREATPEERAQGAALAKKFGLINDPGQSSTTFDVEGPPGMTRDQAFEIFKKQYESGGLTGFNPGDVLNAQSQAASGLDSAKAMLGQMRAGPPGVSTGQLDSFRSLAETTKQSLAAGSTGSLQDRISSSGAILSDFGAKTSALFGSPAPNQISTADFATTVPAVMPINKLTTTDVRATMSGVAAGVGQDYTEFSNDKGVGKFGLDATQLESVGLLKPGTASNYLKQNANDLTTVLKSPAVWTGKQGINNLDALLNNTSAQCTTQQQCMAKGLGIASALGVPVDKLSPKDLGGTSAVFSKDSAAGVAWMRGQLPPDKQADFDAKFQDAQFAIGSADAKFNDAMLQQAPPGEAVDTVNRETLTAALGRVLGNDKIPPIDYNDTTPRLPGPLAAEQRVIINLLAEQRKKFDEVNSTEATAKNADEKIAKLAEITKKLNEISKRAKEQIADIKKLAVPVETALIEMEETLANILALIDDIRVLYLPNLRRIKGG